jgi:hypothetical protein
MSSPAFFARANGPVSGQAPGDIYRTQRALLVVTDAWPESVSILKTGLDALQMEARDDPVLGEAKRKTGVFVERQHLVCILIPPNGSTTTFAAVTVP